MASPEYEQTGATEGQRMHWAALRRARGAGPGGATRLGQGLETSAGGARTMPHSRRTLDAADRWAERFTQDMSGLQEMLKPKPSTPDFSQYDDLSDDDIRELVHELGPTLGAHLKPEEAAALTSYANRA